MLIVVDGACDLSPTMHERADVAVVPFRLLLAGEPFLGSGEDFVNLLRSGAELTSKPPSDQLFSAAFGEHREIVVMATSTYLSAAVDAAAVAARRALAEVRVIDSRTFSAGSGLAVEALVDALADGPDEGDLGKLYEMVVESVHTYAILEHGRILTGHGILGRTRLSRWHRPVIAIRGRARLVRQARSRGRALAWLIRHVNDIFGKPPAAWAVAHASAKDVDDLVATLREAFRSEPVFVTAMNPTAAIHLGPDAIVIAMTAP